MERGIVYDWDGMEKMMRHMFYNEARVAPEEHPVLIAERPLGPKSQKEKYAELLFETFHVPAMMIASNSVLALYSFGSTGGAVVDVGDGCTTITTICKSFLPVNGDSRIDLAGQDVTAEFSRQLTKKGAYFQTTGEREVVRELKEKHCFVSRDPDSEKLRGRITGRPLGQLMSLTDERTLLADEERYLAPEILFDPGRFGVSGPSIPKAIAECFKRWDSVPDLNNFIWNRVFLVGGTTMLPGFADRLQQELLSYAPDAMCVTVRVIPERKYSVWIGGSILASLSTFQQKWFSKQEYDEYGPPGILRNATF